MQNFVQNCQARAGFESFDEISIPAATPFCYSVRLHPTLSHPRCWCSSAPLLLTTAQRRDYPYSPACKPPLTAGTAHAPCRSASPACPHRHVKVSRSFQRPTYFSKLDLQLPDATTTHVKVSSSFRLHFVSDSLINRSDEAQLPGMCWILQKEYTLSGHKVSQEGITRGIIAEVIEEAHFNKQNSIFEALYDGQLGESICARSL